MILRVGQYVSFPWVAGWVKGVEGCKVIMTGGRALAVMWDSRGCRLTRKSHTVAFLLLILYILMILRMGGISGQQRS
jgi:hypothetical protein